MPAKQLPLYFCTAADSGYYARLLNLIGSIHRVNYQELGEILVYDLGLKDQQIKRLKSIKKLSIHKINRVHPDIFRQFKTMPNKYVPGWYAWKSVAIKQALAEVPYTLWIDAGSTVLRPIDLLFQHIKYEGYFLATIGSDIAKQMKCHDVRWCTTRFVAQAFDLDEQQNQWILDQQCVMGGIQGVAAWAANKFVLPMAEMAKDLSYYADDGTAPGGLFCGRHDQPLLSILAYSQGLKVLEQDYAQNVPMLLTGDNGPEPFYITYDKNFVCEKTHIYNSRGNTRGYRKYIRWK